MSIGEIPPWRFALFIGFGSFNVLYKCQRPANGSAPMVA